MLPIGRLDPVKYVDEMLAIHDACYGRDLTPPDPYTGWWWAVWDGDEPVAFAQMIADSEDPTETIYLSRDAVLPAYRGQGMQKRLIAIRLAFARRLGFKFAVTDTYHENLASLNSYIANGFKAYDPKYPWGGKGELYLQRALC